jgi:hypothetical protein
LKYCKIDSLKKNKLLQKYFRKPLFITKEYILQYIKILEKGDYSTFVKKVSLFLKRKKYGTSKIVYLDIYLEYLLEKKNYFSKELIERICVYFLDISRSSFMEIYDKEIINYIKQNSNLLNKVILKNISYLDEDFYKLYDLENKLYPSPPIKDVNSILEEYLFILNKKLKSKQIFKKDYDNTVNELEKYVDWILEDIYLYPAKDHSINSELTVSNTSIEYKNMINKYFSKKVRTILNI